jgi:hypothetical protein
MNAKDERALLRATYRQLASLLGRIKAKRLKGQALEDMKVIEDAVINLEVMTLGKAHQADMKDMQRAEATKKPAEKCKCRGGRGWCAICYGT